MFAGVGAVSTVKVLSDVNVWILKSPQVVTVPPLATIKVGAPVTFDVESWISCHPLVLST